MAVQNTFSVKIGKKDGSGKMINYTHYAVFPIKFANLLDERLDECYLSMRHMQRQEFKPLTPVEITYHNRIYFGWGEEENTVYNHDETVRYFVANDRAIESPVGSRHYNHELYLIELTKYLEMIVVDSLTFTNSLGKNYLKDAYIVAPIFRDADAIPNPDITFVNNYSETTATRPYTSPTAMKNTVNVVSCKNIDPTLTVNGSKMYAGSNFKIYENGKLIYTSTNILDEYKLSLTSSTYEIIYNLYWLPRDSALIYNAEKVIYTFTVVSNQYPLKRLTCTDVINRLLDLAEPLQMGEQPRFSLNAEQAEQFDKIYAPQFSMTKQTLRECLKEVGKVLHGEPRLRINNGAYEIYYDMYGGVKKAWIGRQANIYTGTQNQIETFCSSIDSSAQNLINQTDWAAGVITEPSLSDYKTVRTETQYTRITDSNMLIATDRPIYQIQSLKVLVRSAANETYAAALDITPYVVESTVYNSQLSSYNEAFPYSKAYGIYFTQGENNIKGLSFKVENAAGSVFENYAIVNIIKRAAEANPDIKWDFDSSYPDLAFQITYIPYFDVRIAQTKSYYKDYDKSVALIVNQSANTIESKYYGENLKGMVARLGNPEVSITYTLSKWWQIPKAGWLYDDDHYISAVYVEFLPTYIKCTVGLSKDFNRLNEYIGVSSEKRYYEVSERQTYDRSVLYHEYIVIGDEEEIDSTLIGSSFMSAVADTFTQESTMSRIYFVTAWGGTYENPVSVTVNGQANSPLPCVQLPVTSTAFGNSMAFMWNYQDNYSAGSISKKEAVGGVSGWWQNDYQYTDYYGKMYYYNFDFGPDYISPNIRYDSALATAHQLPQSNIPDVKSNYISTLRAVPYVLRKDSAEILQFNMQVEYVTNWQNLIIGSALASSCGLIRGTDASLKAKLYVLDTPINKFTTSLFATPEMSGKTLSAPVDYTITMKDGLKFNITSANFTADNIPAGGGKSWVMITSPSEERQTVEDERGKVSEQVVYKGGEVLLARNGEVNIGDNIGEIWFTPKHKIFDDAFPIYGEIFRATADNLIADPNTTISQVGDTIQVSGSGNNGKWGFTTPILKFFIGADYEWSFEGLRPIADIGDEKFFTVNLGVDGSATREEYNELWQDTPNNLSITFGTDSGSENTILISSDLPFEFTSFTISRKIKE